MFALSVSVLNIASWFSYFTSGVHTDYLCGALLWWLWDERPPHQLWEELQPSPLYVHYAVHKEWAAPRGTQRAIQAENNPNHHACLPLHQDTDQRHSEGGGNDNQENKTTPPICFICSGSLIKAFKWLLTQSTVFSLTSRPSRWPLRTCRKRLESWLKPHTERSQMLWCFRWFCRDLSQPPSIRSEA